VRSDGLSVCEASLEYLPLEARENSDVCVRVFAWIEQTHSRFALNPFARNHEIEYLE
jgi:hypothetical protein